MNKTFRANLGSLYECFKEDEMTKLLYIKTTSQRADPFTKPLPVARWGEALELICVQNVHSDKSVQRLLIPFQKLLQKVALAQSALHL